MRHNTIHEIIEDLGTSNVEVNPLIWDVIEEESSLKSTIVKVVSIIGGVLAVGFFYSFLYGFFEYKVTGTLLFVLAILQWAICVLGNYQQSIALREGIYVATYIGGFCSLSSAMFLWFNDLNGWIYLLLITLNIFGFLYYKSKITQFVALIMIYGIGTYWLFTENISYWNTAILWLLFFVLYKILKNEWFLRTHSEFVRIRYASTIRALSCIILIGFAQLNITFFSTEIHLLSIFKLGKDANIQLILASSISFIIPLYLMFKTIMLFTTNLKSVYANSVLIGTILVTLFILWFNMSSLTNFLVGTILLICFFEHRLKRGIIITLLFLIVAVISFY